MMKAIRIVAIVILPLILLFSAGYFYLVYKNNIDTPPPSKLEIQQALDKSINWVLQNQNELIKINNPVLWWFLDESANLTNNYKLATLVRKYRDTILNRNSVWTGYWVKRPPFSYISGSLDNIEKYQKFFVYGLTCDVDLGEEIEIQEQLNINFCNWKPYYSSCRTHQLMGIRLLQIKKCGNQNLYKSLSDELIKGIVNLLTWDPRVGDVYIQRTLILAESDHGDMVKPIWLRKILNEQLDSGGWASFYKILPVSDDRYIGFSYKFIDIRTPESNLHTTAQAIYLLSLIQMNNQHNN